jgi:hypothetical protein
MQFSSTASRPVGHVFILPHHKVHSSDRKDRGYVLLNTCVPAETATLAYRSTQITESQQYHATYMSVGGPGTVAPTARAFANRKIRKAAGSYVYPGRLLFWDARHLERSEDNIRLTRMLRETLATCIGIGDDKGFAGPGYRGKLLRTSDETRAALGFRWGIIMTEPRYSGQQRWQVVVPVFRDNRVPLAHDVVIEQKPWVTAINPAWQGACAACTLVCSVSHMDGQVDQITSARIDSATMSEVENRLRLRFSL